MDRPEVDPLFASGAPIARQADGHLAGFGEVVIVDTSALLAFFDADEPDHQGVRHPRRDADRVTVASPDGAGATARRGAILGSLPRTSTIGIRRDEAAGAIRLARWRSRIAFTWESSHAVVGSTTRSMDTRASTESAWSGQGDGAGVPGGRNGPGAREPGGIGPARRHDQSAAAAGSDSHPVDGAM